MFENDPWEQMAIERQFQPLVETRVIGRPATLQYLEQLNESGMRLSTLDQFNLDDAIYDLWRRFLNKTYAEALATILWGDEEMTEKEIMTLEIDEPMDLMYQAITFYNWT